jgi:SWI/SNF-related matrix-associated actin-dependent regulator 1 of chromatin subfamily A
MVRRLKRDVLTDLPPKRRQRVHLRPADAADARELARMRGDVESVRRMVAEAIAAGEARGAGAGGAGVGGGAAAAEAAFVQSQQVMAAWHGTARVKSRAVREYLLELLEQLMATRDKKVLIFAHHTEMLDAVEAALNDFRRGGGGAGAGGGAKGGGGGGGGSGGSSGGGGAAGGSSSWPGAAASRMAQLGYIRLDGRVPSHRRGDLVRRFQEEEACRAAVLQTTVAGVGMTLTRADTVVFAELAWTPAEVLQAEDRAHRIGQASASVNVQYLILRDSVDESMWALLQSKLGTTGQVLDGKGGRLELEEEREGERRDKGQGSLDRWLVAGGGGAGGGGGGGRAASAKENDGGGGGGEPALKRRNISG